MVIEVNRPDQGPVKIFCYMTGAQDWFYVIATNQTDADAAAKVYARRDGIVTLHGPVEVTDKLVIVGKEVPQS